MFFVVVQVILGTLVGIFKPSLVRFFIVFFFFLSVGICVVWGLIDLSFCRLHGWKQIFLL